MSSAAISRVSRQPTVFRVEARIPRPAKSTVRGLMTLEIHAPKKLVRVGMEVGRTKNERPPRQREEHDRCVNDPEQHGSRDITPKLKYQTNCDAQGKYKVEVKAYETRRERNKGRLHHEQRAECAR